MNPRIERFEILGTLGEGGMGVVYLAQQRAPVEREVALKVLSTQVQSDAAAARFEAEQQTLAKLTHPHIAQLFEAGTTDDGLPYFAMEHVLGFDLVDYANEKQLAIKPRLELFFQACAAVQFAHQKGILHRDLKPSNILVQESTAGAQVKLIDFGIAKALDPLSPQDHALTGPLGVGTPAYMAPEAFDSQVLLDTRSDVFSLSVVLQQLLLGSVPYARGSALDIVKQIGAGAIPDANTQWSVLDDEAKTVVLTDRQMTRATMSDLLSGDLGAIVAKGTALDAGDRYDSVSELSQELRAYLDGYPVSARRQGRGYRLRKFIGRHRVGVAMLSVLVLSMITGGGVAGYEARIASIQSKRARSEAARANREAKLASEVTEFMVGLFRLADPDESLGRSISAKEILDRGADSLEEELAGQPELMARMGLAIGQTYLGLGLYADAGSLLKRTLDWSKAASAHDTELTGRILTAIGHQSLYAHDTPGAVKALERADAIFSDTPGRGSVLWAIAHAWLGFTHSYRGDDKSAAPMLSESVEILREADSAPVNERIFALSKHGVSLSVIGEYEQARRSLELAKHLAETVPGGSGYLNLVLNGLTIHYSHAEQYDRALDLAKKTYEENVAQHGDEHPDILNSWSLYIIFLLKTERYPEALAQATRLLATAERLQRPVDQGYALRHLAQAHLRRGELALAWKHANDCVELLDEELGKDHGVSRYARTTWAEVASARGMHKEALDIARPLLERNTDKYGAKSRITRDTQKLIARFEARRARAEK
ncbi:MAG: serine/threonine-protein kinase [Myxococcota bacterium]